MAYDYDFDILYRKGTRSANADSLSRLNDSSTLAEPPIDTVTRQDTQDKWFIGSVSTNHPTESIVVHHVHHMKYLDKAHSISAITLTSDTLTARIREAQRSDPLFMRLDDRTMSADERMTLLTKGLPNIRPYFYRIKRNHRVELHDELWCLVSPNSSQILIPSSAHELKTTILDLVHDHPLAGHLSETKTAHKLLKQYTWPNIYVELKKYIKG
ncbi:hypothetical protein BC833DRAFT_626374 [Globomyces pollinis-pini]|nr:hypothetical protein BC833DRAFT_626374 [Globomyces pollinis-pini]